MDRGAWGATVHSYTELDRTEKLTLNRRDRLARAGEEIRTYSLGSQVIRNYNYFIFSTTLLGEQKAISYLHFRNVKTNTQKSLETWPKLCREQRQRPNPGLLTASSQLLKQALLLRIREELC